MSFKFLTLEGLQLFKVDIYAADECGCRRKGRLGDIVGLAGYLSCGYLLRLVHLIGHIHCLDCLCLYDLLEKWKNVENEWCNLKMDLLNKVLRKFLDLRC